MLYEAARAPAFLPTPPWISNSDLRVQQQLFQNPSPLLLIHQVLLIYHFAMIPAENPRSRSVHTWLSTVAAGSPHLCSKIDNCCAPLTLLLQNRRVASVELVLRLEE